jgi:hypothetical protein
MAIQLIINREWGLAKNENPNQGAFIIDELTDLVEEAVLKEFEAIAARGGVLGAMETGYQRGKIQEESLTYEHQKHDGSYPIVGVNTFRNPHPSCSQQSPAAGPLRHQRAPHHLKVICHASTRPRGCSCVGTRLGASWTPARWCASCTGTTPATMSGGMTWSSSITQAILRR